MIIKDWTEIRENTLLSIFFIDLLIEINDWTIINKEEIRAMYKV